MPPALPPPSLPPPALIFPLFLLQQTIYLLNPRPPGNKLEEYLYTDPGYAPCPPFPLPPPALILPLLPLPQTIYLLNPRPPGNKLEEYLYTYEEPGQVKAEESKSCPGTFYVSSSSPAYVWIDVRAGPHSYGPGGGHKGQVRQEGAGREDGLPY